MNPFYRTPIGAGETHAVRWRIKTLGNLDELFVHHAPTTDDVNPEITMLSWLSELLPAKSLGLLPDFSNKHHSRLFTDGADEPTWRN